MLKGRKYIFNILAVKLETFIYISVIKNNFYILFYSNYETNIIHIKHETSNKNLCYNYDLLKIFDK
jgi:hypothetical protein